MELNKYSLFYKGATPAKFIKFIKEYGFVAEFLPYKETLKEVDLAEVYKYKQT